MERIKSRFKILSLFPILIFMILCLLVWRYDKSAFGFCLAISIIISLRTIHISYFDKKHKALGYFINHNGIIIDQEIVYEWNTLKIIEVKDKRLLGRELTIISEGKSSLELLKLGLDIANKKSFLAQLSKYAPVDNEIRVAIEKYYSSSSR